MLDFELVCLQLVRAIREADFSLYLTALTELLPRMFALDSHTKVHATLLKIFEVQDKYADLNTIISDFKNY